MAKHPFESCVESLGEGNLFSLPRLAEKAGQPIGRLPVSVRVVLESLISIRRAGADIILTYFAKEAARLLA